MKLFVLIFIATLQSDSTSHDSTKGDKTTRVTDLELTRETDYIQNI